MSTSSNKLVVVLAVVMFIGGIVALVVGIVLGIRATETAGTPCVQPVQAAPPTTTPTPTTAAPGPTPSPSVEGRYRYAGVATDTQICSKVGADVMGRQGGSAVDAAIATSLCVGSVNIESNGLGGGHFMTIYKKETNKTFAIMAREQAPAAATQNMYIGLTGYNNNLEGGLSSGIPGEIMGYWEAYKVGGKLPWSVLFEPAIRICEAGFAFPPSTADALVKARDNGYLDRNPNLRNLLTNPETKKYYRRGEKIKRPEYAETLRIVAKEGYQAFYNGSLAPVIVKELKDAGGIITEDDLRSYYAIVKQPIMSNLNNNMRIISPPPPAGGLVLHYILNILNGYNFTPYDLMTSEKTILTYHRIVEAFKFAFAKRSEMGDADVEDQEFKDRIDNLVKNMTSQDYASDVRSQIDDDETHETKHYGPAFSNLEDSGTGHISVLAPNGDAVAVTTTINLHFGSKVVGSQTGIVYNNEMDDFSTPNTTDSWGIPASPSNFIKPGKRPLSSMSPTIIVQDDGDVSMVVGASGGTRIITGTALTVINALWFGKRIKESVDNPRIHHQLLPPYIRVEKGFPQYIIDGLKAKGHEIKMYSKAGSYVQAVLQKSTNKITANCDYRKYGIPDGY